MLAQRTSLSAKQNDRLGRVRVRDHESNGLLGRQRRFVGPPAVQVSISLMDAPVDGVTAVYVKITSMWIKKAGGPAVELPLTTTPMTVNLMELTDKNAAILINEAVIEPGKYEWLSMDIAAERTCATRTS